MTVGNGATNLSSYAYTLGAAGNRTGVTEQGGRSISWTYDNLYRLTNETIAGDTHGQNGSIGYQYDAVGNRLNRTSSVAAVPSATSTYDANDRLTNDTYDANGNTTASNSKLYGYDFENRLTQLTDGGNGATYIYDGDGNRVGKIAGGVTTNYLVDTNNLTGYAQVVEELQSGAVTKQFTYGHDLISQRIVGGSVSYYGYDGHGSVRLLTNASGAVTDTYDYDAFGNLISRTGTTDNEYLYTGERFDANLGFYYLRARYMNPSSGRFFTQDSYEGKSSDPLTLHKYLYANADGVNTIDPSGNIGIANLIVAAGIVIGLASFLFQTDRVKAPSGDAIDDNYYKTKADYEDAQIHLAFLIFALVNVSVGARSATGSATRPSIGGMRGGLGRYTPYNPFDNLENCSSCVAAVIKQRLKKGDELITAHNIESEFPHGNLPTARATANYIADASGTNLVSVNGASSGFTSANGPGHYILVREPTVDNIGHVVYGYINKYGGRYILDPQSNRAYWLRPNDEKLPTALFDSPAKVFKVQE